MIWLCVAVQDAVVLPNKSLHIWMDLSYTWLFSLYSYLSQNFGTTWIFVWHKLLLILVSSETSQKVRWWFFQITYQLFLCNRNHHQLTSKAAQICNHWWLIFFLPWTIKYHMKVEYILKGTPHKRVATVLPNLKQNLIIGHFLSNRLACNNKMSPKVLNIKDVQFDD